MANKKTSSKKTQNTSKKCEKRSALPFILVGLIIILLLLVLFLPTNKVESPPPQKSDKEVVMTPESDPILNEAIIAEKTEPEIDPEFLANPVMKLDEPNVVAPPMTDDEELVYTFLTEYNKKNFKEACDLLVDTKCDATIPSSVERFGEELGKMKNGYQNISVHQVEVPDFHSDIVCVEYDYRYLSSSNTNPIHETMSFYVQNGKITYRICEDKTRDGEDIPCPIRSRRDFCLE